MSPRRPKRPFSHHEEPSARESAEDSEPPQLSQQPEPREQEQEPDPADQADRLVPEDDAGDLGPENHHEAVVRFSTAEQGRRPSEHRRKSVESIADEIFDEDDVADTEDAEPLAFPEPGTVTVRRRRRRGLLWAGGASALLVAIVAVLYFSPLLTIHHVQVDRHELLTEDRAQELLQPLYGRPLPQVGNAQVKELLADEAVVEDVVVQGELPDTLTVEVIEHPPVAEVDDGDALLFYNEHGEVIRSFEDPDDEDAQGYATPAISNEVAWQDDVVFGTIVSVLGELPASARESMDSATADSIDSVRLILDDGRTIFWGGEDHGADKAAVLEVLLDSDAPDFTDVDTIDISTPDTPVTR